VHDPNSRRHNFKTIEGLHAPFEKLITRLVAFEFHFHVELERVRPRGIIDLHGVIDDEIDRHERLNNFRIFIQTRGRRAHRGEID
jgi:hypothetical protein